MSARRPPARPAAPPPGCTENDCGRMQAQALTRIADHADRLFGHPDDPEPSPGMKALTDLGEIAGKWLNFCHFMRKWFPKVGWWLIPLVLTVIFNGGSELSDALVRALTAYLQMQTGG
ncbi:hypothetical protein [Brevundimonas sp. A19_0]|uniref:hypothetical protein n=1 Tax=Brevundimonas sp. A19_0 TaxID=2821087 RepID=UPI001ADB8C85|nr:hypothetical protein [Brevundimonas sp. A19_0]MBO9502506.1 hypothetical protein [Brevundimonas sp. A19_0]